MTGETHDNDECVPFDDDRLDEDFVLEDLVEEDEGAFEAPSAEVDAAPEVSSEQDEVSAEDLLFADEEPAAEASETFEGASFSEQGSTDWSGDELELGELDDEVEEAVQPVEQEELRAATESVAAELGSLLDAEEGFALEEDVDLEVVDEDADAAAEPAMFVLDDGDDLWGEVEAEEVVGATEPTESAPAMPAATYESTWSESAEELPVEDEPVEEPLEFELEVADAAEAPAAAGEGYELFAEFVDGDEPAAEPEEGAEEPAKFGVVSHELPPLTGEREGLSIFDEVEPGQDGAVAADGSDEGDLPPAFDLVDNAGDDAPLEAGWEPLPDTSVDQLSQVDGVERTDEPEEVEYDTSGYEEDEVYDEVFDEQGSDEADVDEREYTPEELEDVEGHDIYTDEEEEHEGVVIGGPGSSRRRIGLALSIAASVAVVGLCAAVVGRPEWFGLAVSVERVAKVEVPRPRVALSISEPAEVVVPGASAEVESSSAGPSEVDPAAGVEPAPEAAVSGGDGEPSSPEPEPSSSEPVLAPPAAVPAAPTQEPSVAGEAPVLPSPSSDSLPPALPVAPIAETVPPSAELTRFGDQLLVGGMGVGETARSAAVEGVLPGSRAFAQLANGNFFIGRVKRMADDAVTLRVATGEVTLAKAELVQLTQLGSADYESLQQVTQGSVRLTNNNRLVGGILRSIADDHVVLEFRSNRVMLPKSAVGEIVNGDGNGSVRLGTTSEEDGWLQQIAERELGTGRGLEPAAPLPSTTPERRR